MADAGVCRVREITLGGRQIGIQPSGGIAPHKKELAMLRHMQHTAQLVWDFQSQALKHKALSLLRSPIAKRQVCWGLRSTTRYEAEIAFFWRRLYHESRHILICGGFHRIRTMMQLCASVATLQSSGTHSLGRYSNHVAPRATATSDRSWHSAALNG